MTLSKPFRGEEAPITYQPNGNASEPPTSNITNYELVSYNGMEIGPFYSSGAAHIRFENEIETKPAEGAQ